MIRPPPAPFLADAARGQMALSGEGRAMRRLREDFDIIGLVGGAAVFLVLLGLMTWH